MLVVTDKGLVEHGVAGKVFAVLEQEKLDYIVYDKTKPNTRDVDCIAAYRLAQEKKIDFIVGLGGGSSMDPAARRRSSSLSLLDALRQRGLDH